MYDTPFYFSESQRQNIAVDSMPLPYARNVYRKLSSEGFEGSVLQRALEARLMPSKESLKLALATKGVAVYFAIEVKDRTRVKRMFTRIFSELEVSGEIEVKGDFIEARCEPVGVEVKINRRAGG